MRRCLLLLLLVSAGCSRRPPAKAGYDQAWTAFRQGRLGQAQELVGSALKDYHGDPASDELLQLRLLKLEILLAQWNLPDAQALKDQLKDPKTGALHLRWLVDMAEAASKQN